MTKKRVSWIDVARGIGIILVVYGHALSADSYRYIIYAFHMPLFFFLSGLVFTYRPEQALVSFLYKNSRALLYPYVIFALLSFGLWLLTKEPSQAEQLLQFLSIFYGNGNNNLLAFNNLLWFLPCLFIVRLGFYLITGRGVKRSLLLVTLFVFSLIGYVFSLVFSGWKLFFGIETALTALVFFGAGYIFMQTMERGKVLLQKYSWPIFFASVGLCVIFAVLNYQEYGLQIDLRQNRLNNYLYFYSAAFAGISGIIVLSSSITSNRVLEYLGKRSLVIFAWHLIAFPYISRFLSLTKGNSYLSLLPGYVSQVFYTIFSIIIVLVLAFLIEKIAALFRPGRAG
jgi:acyltransferase